MRWCRTGAMLSHRVRRLANVVGIVAYVLEENVEEMSVATAIVEELHVVSGRRHARVGTLLMRSALRVAREAGMLCAALMVQCSNTGAMPF